MDSQTIYDKLDIESISLKNIDINKLSDAEVDIILENIFLVI